MNVARLTSKANYIYDIKQDSAADPKKMHSIINDLSYNKTSMSYPDEDISILCEKICNFFNTKIDKIVQNINKNRISQENLNTVNYSTINSNLSNLHSFSHLSQSDVKKIIMECSSQSCILDSIPTKMLKQ